METRTACFSGLAPFKSQRPRRVSLIKAGTRCASQDQVQQVRDLQRRIVLQGSVATLSALLLRSESAYAAPKQPTEQVTSKLLCGPECQNDIKSVEETKTASGLRYKDIKVGTGPVPPTGYQVVAHYVAMTPDGRVVDSSLDKGRPYDLRIGAGQIVAGLDEGVASMRVGGLRRIYVPGNLSFPKGLASGPGRPRIPPASPVMFDVELLYIPGLDDEE